MGQAAAFTKNQFQHPRRRRRFEQCLGKLTAQRVIHEHRRIGDNGGDLLAQPRLVAAVGDAFGNKIRRASRGFTQRHAETEKIFGVHNSKLHRSER
jgi:hypothetical protein